jgi:hypothetical protein
MYLLPAYADVICWRFANPDGDVDVKTDAGGGS